MIYREPAGALVKKFGMQTSPVSQALSPERRTRLEQAARIAKVSLDDLNGVRPWLAGATLEDAGYRSAGLTGKSANTVLSGRAGRAGIPHSSEFAAKDDVFAWFGAMTATKEQQFLSFVVDGVLLDRAGSEAISTRWLSGDAGPAVGFVDHERLAYPQLYAKLTLERNRAWIPRFDAMLQEPKPAMVVVGLYIWSGHKTCSPSHEKRDSWSSEASFPEPNPQALRSTCH